MRLLKLVVLAVAGAMVMLVGLAGPAGAEPDPPGRGASVRGLTTATIKQGVAHDPIGNLIVLAQDPDTPGSAPITGQIDPT